MRWRRNSTAVVMAALAVLGAAPGADARARRTVAAQIADLENRYSQTFVTGDAATADRLLADAFIGFGSDGKPTDKASMLAEVRREPHQTSARITSLTVRAHGDTALALGTEEDTTPGSKEVARRQWLDTWKHAPAGWRLVASAEIAVGR